MYIFARILPQEILKRIEHYIDESIDRTPILVE